MNYYLGLDNGGTTTKAALYTADGTEVGAASIDTAMDAPEPGFAECDMEAMWRANCAVVRSLLGKTGVDAREIKCLAVCGHGKGLYLWGKDGKPAGKGIGSTDSRALGYVSRWERDGTAESVRRISCQRILACQPVALLAWLRDNEPQILGNTRWVFSCKDYIRFRFTGEAFAEYSDSSGSNLLNLYTRDYDDRLLDLFGVRDIRPALPPLRPACEVCGYVSAKAAGECGLAEGTPVAGGLFDINACALAAGITDERCVCMIAGTWSINEYIRREPYLGDAGQMNSLFAADGYYLIEECSPTSAGNQKWLLKTLLPEYCAAIKDGGGNPYSEIDRQIAGLGAGAACPVFLPFILGSNAHPNARGSLVGIGASHTRAHILRAVYEGICFSHRQHLDRLEQTRDSAPDCIRLVGGAAKSAVWTQMFADVMELPVETVTVSESGALGSAICAAVAAGEYDSVSEAIRGMVRISSRVEPDRVSAGIYRRKYALYQKTVAALDTVWDDLRLLETESEALR